MGQLLYEVCEKLLAALPTQPGLKVELFDPSLNCLSP